MTVKYINEVSLRRLISKIKSALAAKSDTSHTHDRVNGYKVVVSETVPTINDTLVITIVME